MGIPEGGSTGGEFGTGGFTCTGCGAWCQYGQPHVCPSYPSTTLPYQNYPYYYGQGTYGDNIALARIADAMEKIATELEKFSSEAKEATRLTKKLINLLEKSKK